MSISNCTLISSDKIKDSYLKFLSNQPIEIFCPFITYSVLEGIIAHSSNISRIITRWELSDFEQGFADLEIYNLCKSNNIDLYINPRVHLKATINEQIAVFLSSANLTGKGLNFNNSRDHNYELSTIVGVKGIQDLVYFEQIVQDSVYVTKLVFEEIKERVEELNLNKFSEPKEFSFMKDKFYYISQLPQTSHPSLLYEYYCESKSDYSKEEYNCAIHDLSIYSVEEDLDYDDFMNALAYSFFQHPFIEELINQVKKDGFIYFGRVKEWIQKRCLDVPVPSRRDLIGVTQVLYKWIEELGEGKFEVDRPNYSQRLKIVD